MRYRCNMCLLLGLVMCMRVHVWHVGLIQFKGCKKYWRVVSRKFQNDVNNS